MSTGVCPNSREGIPVIPASPAQHLQSRASITSIKIWKENIRVHLFYIDALTFLNSNIGINSSSIYSSICHCM